MTEIVGNRRQTVDRSFAASQYLYAKMERQITWCEAPYATICVATYATSCVIVIVTINVILDTTFSVIVSVTNCCEKVY